MKRYGDWITTASGTKFWPLDPREEDVKIEDIAHALSNTCRFGGHCRQFYPVAQHCCLMTQHATPQAQLAALLHDAAEAYIGDIVTGLKRELRYTNYDGYGHELRDAEDQLLLVISKALNVPEMHSFNVQNEVKELDKRMLATEQRDIMSDGLEWASTKGIEPFTDPIVPWGPGEGTKRTFLHLYNCLQNRGSRAQLQAQTQTPPAGPV